MGTGHCAGDHPYGQAERFFRGPYAQIPFEESRFEIGVDTGPAIEIEIETEIYIYFGFDRPTATSSGRVDVKTIEVLQEICYGVKPCYGAAIVSVYRQLVSTSIPRCAVLSWEIRPRHTLSIHLRGDSWYEPYQVD